MHTSGTFFLPGPTEVRPEVLAAMQQPMIAHRTPEFEALFARLQEGLRELFGTRRPIFIAGCSGTGMMEAAVRCARPGRVLSLVNGAFSSRFAEIARRCAREVDVIEAPPGATVPLDVVRQQLRSERYSALTVVHSETSTGALTDLRTIGELAREYDVLSLVDSVSGVGGAPMACDVWELDLVLSASQKAMAIPAGLAFAVASERYMEHVASAPSRGMYLDLLQFAEFARKNQTPTTPALALFRALDRQLALIAEDGGASARWERHAAMASVAWDWGDSLREAIHPDLGCLAHSGARSPTVTAITLPAGLPAATVVRAVEGRGFVITGGNGATSDSVIRVGHMGEHTPAGVSACLDAVGDALEELLSR